MTSPAARPEAGSADDQKLQKDGLGTPGRRSPVVVSFDPQPVLAEREHGGGFAKPPNWQRPANEQQSTQKSQRCEKAERGGTTPAVLSCSVAPKGSSE